MRNTLRGPKFITRSTLNRRVRLLFERRLIPQAERRKYARERVWMAPARHRLEDRLRAIRGESR